jgi:hypothetical protein
VEGPRCYPSNKRDGPEGTAPGSRALSDALTRWEDRDVVQISHIITSDELSSDEKDRQIFEDGSDLLLSSERAPNVSVTPTGSSVQADTVVGPLSRSRLGSGIDQQCQPSAGQDNVCVIVGRAGRLYPDVEL